MRLFKEELFKVNRQNKNYMCLIDNLALKVKGVQNTIEQFIKILSNLYILN